jgi:MFS transporter, DHA1 family, multidrug resistance protein
MAGPTFLQFTTYVVYQRKHLQPRIKNDPTFRHENRLEMGLVAGAFIPISLMMFGWSARPSVHWCVRSLPVQLRAEG